ncbi:RRM domain-containing protein [Plasmodiophora brassicae]
MSDSDVVAAPPPTEQQPAGAAERQPDADNRDSSTPVQTGAVAEDDHGMPTEQEAEATSADAVAAQAVSSADVAVGDGHISAAEKRPREASPPATIPVSKKPVHERESVAATQTSPERPSTEPKLVLDRGSNLIINFVPRSLNDSLLRDLFSPFGEIESARTIVDRNTGQCQGYGFVKFFTNESAAKAVLHFQKAAADERELKVHFARPATTHKQCNLYVTGLPIHFTDDDAANVFKDYGPVVETKILIGKDGVSRGCGFVRLSDIAKTNAAVAALHDSVPPGCTSRIQVQFAAGTKREAQMLQQQRQARVALPFGAPPAGVAYPPAYAAPYAAPPVAYAGAYGGVDPYAAYARGAYSSPAPATPYAYPDPYAAAAAGAYAPVRGGRDVVAPYVPPVAPPGVPPSAPVPQMNTRHQVYTGVCLFVFNLPMEYEEATLQNMFVQFGEVTNVKIMRDPATGRSKGYGFVNLATQQQADAAIAALNGYPVGGKLLKVQYKTAGPSAGKAPGAAQQPYATPYAPPVAYGQPQVYGQVPQPYVHVQPQYGQQPQPRHPSYPHMY